jgi:deoxyribose-phosphate aldolase
MSKTYRGFSREQIAQTLDHSVLKPNATMDEALAGALLAKTEQVASYCIRPMDVAFASLELTNSGVPVCTVIGFPHGTTTTETKVFETQQAIIHGAREIDMVMNISALISGDLDYVERDIVAVVSAVRESRLDIPVKVIFETALLSDEQIITCCRLTEQAGADFVKTSTGFAAAGATLEHVALMKACVGDRLKVKASGGIRNIDQVVDFLNAGASRCGTSVADEILKQFDQKSE